MIRNASCFSAHIHGFLREGELRDLRREACGVSFERRESYVDGVVSRRCGLANLTSDLALTVRDRVRHAAVDANREWGLEIGGEPDPWLFVCEYCEGDCFQWHRDWLPGDTRLGRWKIGASLQLSAHDAYEGGELEFFTGSISHPTWTAPRDAGSLTLFISHAFHRVTTITQGQRLSAVMFVSGKNPLQ